MNVRSFYFFCDQSQDFYRAKHQKRVVKIGVGLISEKLIAQKQNGTFVLCLIQDRYLIMILCITRTVRVYLRRHAVNGCTALMQSSGITTQKRYRERQCRFS